MTAAERQKAYRIRQKIKAQALLGGGETIELAWFGTNADGYHVAIDAEGNRVELKVRAAEPPVQISSNHTIEPVKAKQVYSPKGMPKEQYDHAVEMIRDKGMTKDEARIALTKSRDKKLGSRMVALIDALPDGPDWADSFPDWSA